MSKNNLVSLIVVLGISVQVSACSSSSDAGPSGAAGAAPGSPAGGSNPGGSSGGSPATSAGATSAGGTPGVGGVSAGGASPTGGAGPTGGASAAGGAGGASTLTLADACQKNCTLAAGLTGCSTTADVCVQSCLKTFDNTSKVNATLGREYTEMMTCVAGDTAEFSSSASFMCSKPDRALNKWSPGPDSKCEDAICLWNCNDGTPGNFDPFVDIRCTCSSV